MFSSETLARITIQVPESFVSAATAILTRFKLLHLIRIDETPLGRLGFRAEGDAELLAELEELLQRVSTLMDSLHVKPTDVVSEEQVVPEKDVFKIKARLDSILGEVESSVSTLESAAAALSEKRALFDRFSLLPGDLDFSRLRERCFVHWVIGFVPTHGLEKLRESLSQIHHAIVELETVQDRSLLLVFGLLKDKPVFERALQGALWESVTLPPEVEGTAEALAESLRDEIDRLGVEVRHLSDQLDGFREQYGDELSNLLQKTLAARQMLAARRFFGKIDKSYLISGWIPKRLCEAVEAELKQATEGRILFEIVDPKDLRDVREGIIKIPILFNNPMLISPFEKLTSLYGIPRYREVEPTVFFALSFLLLFGMMFGDLGQGAVLCGIGYYVFRRFYAHMDYGIILMECGVSSMLFGCLYGSVFGLDTVIPALWFRPMENIPRFVTITLVLGVALVSLGLVLNLVNAMRLGEHEKLLSGSGLAGALIYWMTAGLALKYLATGTVAPSEWNLLGWACTVLVMVMIFHRPLFRLIVKREHLTHVLTQSGLLSELIESIVETFDDLLRFVASTVSFIRVAAFALSHAALFIAVFSIANLISHEKGTGLSYWLVVAIGNVVVILLEGMVVSIQTVRLEYYEFFGKFFRGGGEKFRPFDRAI